MFKQIEIYSIIIDIGMSRAEYHRNLRKRNNFFKNLHIIDNSTPGYDKDSNIFIEKLLNIYNLIFKDVLKKFNDYNIKIDKLILDINNLVDELKEKELKEKELKEKELKEKELIE